MFCAHTDSDFLTQCIQLLMMKQHTKGKKAKKASVLLTISNKYSFFLRVFEPTYQYSNANSQKRFYQSSQFQKSMK